MKVNMLQYVLRCLFFVCCTLIFVNCNGQVYNRDFDLFLLKFANFEMPANPTELLAAIERKGNFEQNKILSNDYDKFIREKGDTYWEFSDFFEYNFIGKKKLENCWILLYYREFLCDDVNLQKSEFILSTFALDGKIISSLPIAGGYGDILTFNSEIYSPEKIEVNYTKYSEKGEKKYSKYYCIQKDGKIVLKK